MLPRTHETQKSVMEMPKDIAMHLPRKGPVSLGAGYLSGLHWPESGMSCATSAQ